MKFSQNLSKILKLYFRRIILRRRRPQKHFDLNRKNLFIFPSATGWALVFVSALLWLLGTNYDNNLILALAFVLLSVFIICILHTHNALSGLSISANRAYPCFVGEHGEIEVKLARHRRQPYHNIVLQWDDNNPVNVDLTESDQILVKIFVEAEYRGWYRPSLLLVESYYPLGLMRCWTWLNVDIDLLSYPRAVAAGPIPSSTAKLGSGDEQHLLAAGAEDFNGLRSYQRGDSLKHVSWKHYAQGKGMHSKEYRAYSDSSLWVDWEYLAGVNREARLQRLCDWVLQLSRGNSPYGLRLPGQEIKPDLGLAHKQQCLKALALFEFIPPKGSPYV